MSFSAISSPHSLSGIDNSKSSSLNVLQEVLAGEYTQEELT